MLAITVFLFKSTRCCSFFKKEYLIFNVFFWSVPRPLIHVCGCTWKPNSKMLLYFFAHEQTAGSSFPWLCKDGIIARITDRLVGLSCFLYVLWQMAYLAAWPCRDAWNKQRDDRTADIAEGWLPRVNFYWKQIFFQYNQVNILWLIKTFHELILEITIKCNSKFSKHLNIVCMTDLEIIWSTNNMINIYDRDRKLKWKCQL